MVGGDDEAAPVEVADGFLESLLAYLEHFADDVGVAFVAQRTLSVVLPEVAEQPVGEVGGELPAGGLEGDVGLPVAPHLADIGLQAVAGVDVLEYLRVVDESRVAVLDDAFESEVSLLPDKDVDGLSGSERCGVAVEEPVYFRCGDDAVAL